jgi:hypothetical protein
MSARTAPTGEKEITMITKGTEQMVVERRGF